LSCSLGCASALVTFICVFCTLRTQTISRSIHVQLHRARRRRRRR
jgi:hypothetical protein